MARECFALSRNLSLYICVENSTFETQKNVCDLILSANFSNIEQVFYMKIAQPFSILHVFDTLNDVRMYIT